MCHTFKILSFIAVVLFFVAMVFELIDLFGCGVNGYYHWIRFKNVTNEINAGIVVTGLITVG